MIRFLSVCSGLEGASLATHDLGWSPVGFAEIEAFPSAIIAERFGSNMPGEPLSGNAPPNFGDFTAIDLDRLGSVDILIGGTPCQAFSVAGKRLSLADARGNLSLAYVVLAHELARSHGLRNAMWENVPGVLNTPDNAFGCFLGALVGHDTAFPQPRGAGWPSAGMADGPRARCAWRVLDAQYFGLAQRRERVFVVADFGNGADPAAVLFEPIGLQGNPAPRRETRERVAGALSARSEGGGGLGTDFDIAGGLQPVAFGGNRTSGELDVAAALNAHGGPHGRLDFESETFVCAPPLTSNPYGDHESREGLLVAHSLRGEGFDASEDGTGRGTPLVPVQAFYSTESRCDNIPPEGLSPPLKVGSNGGGQPPAIAFTSKDYGADASADLAPTMRSMGHNESHANGGGQLAIAFDLRGREGGAQFEGPHDTANIRAASGGSSRSYVTQQWAVRRLTPTECERLQGIPDGHTRIPWRGKRSEDCPDGPRYKALGNSWAVPVVAWIAKRLNAGLNRSAA